MIFFINFAACYKMRSPESMEKKKILYPVIFIMLIFIYLFIYLLLKHFMSFISFLQALIQLFAKP